MKKFFPTNQGDFTVSLNNSQIAIICNERVLGELIPLKNANDRMFAELWENETIPTCVKNAVEWFYARFSSK